MASNSLNLIGIASNDPEELKRLIASWQKERKEMISVKRGKDLETIGAREKLKNRPFQPFKVGVFERFQGNQVWAGVLSYLTDPVDMVSAKQTCRSFREIMEEPLNERAVKEVFKILNRKEYLVLGKSDAEGKDVLKLRLVSKFWKQATENILMMNSFSVILECPKELQFRYPHHLDKNYELPDVLRNYFVSPSIIQILRVDEARLAEVENFYPKILEFLGNHGAAIRGLEIKWNLTDPALGRFERLLRLVGRMPNLRALAMKKQEGLMSRAEEARLLQDQDEDFRRSLGSLCAPPMILSLESFSIVGYAEMDSLVLEILRKSVNLKNVFLRADSFERVASVGDWPMFQKTSDLNILNISCNGAGIEVKYVGCWI